MAVMFPANLHETELPNDDNSRLMGKKIRSGLGWYLQRLRVMSFSEVIHRINQLRWLWFLRLVQRAGRFHAALNTAQSGSEFRFCSSSEQKLPELPWEFDANNNEVKDLLKGRRKVLGWDWEWHADDPFVWHRAPDTGKYWPREFFAKIPYRAGNDYGDVRVAWEPSRLQHLVTLGLLVRHAADAETRTEAITQLEAQLLSWVRTNPAFVGIHYISAMECSLRIMALCHTLDLVRDKLLHPAQVWQALAHLVHTHAFLIERRLSLFSSSGNHTIAECCGLIYAGTLFPELAAARRWKELGVNLLAKEAKRQVLPDGGGIEQSLWYHLFVTDLLGLVSRLLEHSGESIPADIHGAYERARSFLNTLANTSDTLPMIGDSDNGHALSPFLRISWDRKKQSQDLTTFIDSGYTVLNAAEHDITMIFDHGPLGMPPGYGHGHADALAVYLRLNNQVILDGPGTYTYNSDLSWRSYFRGTRAHNTVAVDGLDQAQQETAFIWSQPFRAFLVDRERSAEGDVRLLGYHDGYVGRARVTHWRGLIYKRSNRWVIWDYLAGEGSHLLELNWHTTVPVEKTGFGFFLKAQGPIINMSLSGGETSIREAHTDPIYGWRSKVYGIKEPCYTISSRYHGGLPHEFITRLSFDSDVVDFPINDELNKLRRSVS